MNYSIDCAFCGTELHATETTYPEAKSRGLVYLRVRCVPCNAVVESAGIGMENSILDMEDKIKERRGTTPDSWRIKVRPERNRKRG